MTPDKDDLPTVDQFVTEPGLKGHFTRHQAQGAIPNGSRVVKTWAEEGDAHEVGDKATVLGSMFTVETGYFYFVQWDASPELAVGCMAAKISEDFKQ